MKYTIVKDVITLLEEFEQENSERKVYPADISGFKKWMAEQVVDENNYDDIKWEGKDIGRSPESVINTLIVHMNRYAKSYSKAAIHGSNFSTQDEFIYLITLRAFGEMTKMDLIKKNVHEKPAGIQIINRLIAQGWVLQKDSLLDKRSKILAITEKGINELEQQMSKIRTASTIVTGNLSYAEKMELIRLLNKLNDFHLPIYNQNIEPEHLLEKALKKTN